LVDVDFVRVTEKVSMISLVPGTRGLKAVSGEEGLWGGEMRSNSFPVGARSDVSHKKDPKETRRG